MISTLIRIPLYEVHFIMACFDLYKNKEKISKRAIVARAKEFIRKQVLNPNTPSPVLPTSEVDRIFVEGKVHRYFRFEILEQKNKINSGRRIGAGRLKGSKNKFKTVNGKKVKIINRGF